MSSADSMLAKSSMLMPSAVVAAVFDLLSSRLWLRYSRARRRYSLRTTSSGSMMRTPLMPSTMTDFVFGNGFAGVVQADDGRDVEAAA